MSGTVKKKIKHRVLRNSVAWSHGHNLTSALLNIRGKELQLLTKFAMWMDAEQIMNSGIRMHLELLVIV